MENKEKLGQEPAFSKAAFYHPDGGIDSPQEGMSRRFYAACAAMQGILSNQELRMDVIDASRKRSLNPDEIPTDEFFGKVALQYADGLLKQENL